MKAKNIYGGRLARGKLGNTIISQAHSSTQTVRRYFKPTNPNTEKQKNRRELFKQSAKEYKGLSEEEKAIFRLEAKEQKTTPTALFFLWYLENAGQLAFCGLARCGFARLNRGGI